VYDADEGVLDGVASLLRHRELVGKETPALAIGVLLLVNPKCVAWRVESKDKSSS